MLLLRDVTAGLCLETECMENRILRNTKRSLSEEVRGPLRTLLQFCKILKESAIGETAKLLDVLQQGLQVTELNVGNILDLSNYRQRGKINLHLEEFDLR